MCTRERCGTDPTTARQYRCEATQLPVAVELRSMGFHCLYQIARNCCVATSSDLVGGHSWRRLLGNYEGLDTAIIGLHLVISIVLMLRDLARLSLEIIDSF